MTVVTADGGCLCGAVRYSVKGELLWTGYCHCESCRRHTSSPVASFTCFWEKDAMFHGDNLGVYKSSPEVERTFCKVCGTPISYMISSRPGELQLYTMTLDFPEKMTPMEHVHCEEQLPWFRVDDELPRHKGSALDDE